MKQLIAVFPILFESQNYEPGDELPTHNAGLVEVWIGNGTAIRRNPKSGAQKRGRQPPPQGFPVMLTLPPERSRI